MDKDEKRFMYVVAKSVTMTDKPDGEKKPLCKIPFGAAVTYLRRNKGTENGRVKVTYSYAEGSRKNRKKVTVSGWVPAIGLSENKIEDYAKLTYYNATGKKIPMFNRYKGEIIGYLPPLGQVDVIAKVGHWGLTTKGWTYGKWLRRYKDIAYEEDAKTAMLAVLSWAVNDYRRYVRILREKKYMRHDFRHAQSEFLGVMQEIDVIREWFSSEGYSMFFDSISGSERLEMLDKEVGVNDNWWIEQERIRKQIRAKPKKNP
ncbi:MAG: hypothetical protein II008_06465 [Oscillospiraceae bacterium]|nr:hypothetical protein [Oscillospiraceae bacterium]